MKKSGPSIAELTSAVTDNGRRGEPRPGCDCVQCFGYCIVDADEAFRIQTERQHNARMRSEVRPLNFEDLPA